ncbi:MAG: hypothetical protein EZS28_044674, partial [Streblomastix strix]
WESLICVYGGFTVSKIGLSDGIIGN